MMFAALGNIASEDTSQMINLMILKYEPRSLGDSNGQQNYG